MTKKKDKKKQLYNRNGMLVPYMTEKEFQKRKKKVMRMKFP